MYAHIPRNGYTNHAYTKSPIPPDPANSQMVHPVVSSFTSGRSELEKAWKFVRADHSRRGAHQALKSTRFQVRFEAGNNEWVKLKFNRISVLASGIFADKVIHSSWFKILSKMY